MAAGPGHRAGFVSGTECVGKFNFPGSAAHVSKLWSEIIVQPCTSNIHVHKAFLH